MDYQLFQPAFCFLFTLAALPLASLLRRSSAQTRYRALPPGLGLQGLLKLAVLNLCLFLGLLLLGAGLEWASQPLYLLQGADSLFAPGCWLAAAGRLLAEIGRRGWSLALLSAPLLLSLWKVTELRWPARALEFLGLLLSLPFLGRAVLALLMPTRDGGDALLLALALWSLPLLLLLLSRHRSNFWSRYRSWREEGATREISPPLELLHSGQASAPVIQQPGATRRISPAPLL